jgi:hypothetical protein
MTYNDLELALHFLKKVVARGQEEDLLVQLVEKMEKELEQRRSKRG